MKRQILLSIFFALIIVSFTNAIIPSRAHKTFSNTSKISNGSLNEKFDPVTYVFNYTKSFYHRGCLVSANFSVSITFDTETGSLIGVSATLTSGSVTCPQINEVKVATISPSYGSHYVNGVNFSSDISEWDDAMNSIEQEIIDDINADLDSVR